MTQLERILALPKETRADQGLLHTPVEIVQQPECWRETVETVKASADELSEFLKFDGPTNTGRRIVLAGAGTSEFIGTSVEAALRVMLKMDVDTRATTDIITSWGEIFIPGRDYLVISFARSGNSPESTAAFDLVNAKVPGARQLVITCNQNGDLAKRASEDPSAYCLLLPERTNDNGLAMTSSYSSMAIAAMALGFLDDLDRYMVVVGHLCAQAAAVIAQSDTIYDLAQRSWHRGVFLGTSGLYGAALDGHLKVSELTNGTLMCRCDTYPGLRHGPQVVINRDTIVLALVSSDSHSRKYELDLLRQLKEQGKFGALLVIGPDLDEGFADCATDAIAVPRATAPNSDLLAAPYGIVGPQLFGLFKSSALGLAPDAPSADGVISRVVEGVTIHEPK